MAKYLQNSKEMHKHKKKRLEKKMYNYYSELRFKIAIPNIHSLNRLKFSGFGGDQDSPSIKFKLDNRADIEIYETIYGYVLEFNGRPWYWNVLCDVEIHFIIRCIRQVVQHDKQIVLCEFKTRPKSPVNE